MAPLSDVLYVQISRPLSPVSVVTRFALLFVLLGALCGAARAQTYTQGLPTVGNSTPTAAPSQMLIDATQFTGAPDMCLQIKNACLKLGTGGYPSGATIDARGFTGDRVCAANNATQMLNGCAANGGKLLLGTVHLYARWADGRHQWPLR